MSNRQSFPPIRSPALRSFSSVLGLTGTCTCTPPGSGGRVGIDRDEDGFLDRDEQNACSDPADPASTP